jgi:hypothetical protein
VEKLVSKFAFKFNLYRYTSDIMASPAGDSIRKMFADMGAVGLRTTSIQLTHSA